MKKTLKQFIVNDTLNFFKQVKQNYKIKKSLNLFKALGRNRLSIFLNKLKQMSYTVISILELECWVTKEPVSFVNKTCGKHIENIKIGDKWANNVFDCAWFKVAGTIPHEYIDKNIVYLLNTGGEGLIYDCDGQLKQAITTYASDYDYTLGLPTKKVVQHFCGSEVKFWIDAGANDLFGKFKNKSKIEQACIAVCNEQVRALSYDIEVLLWAYDAEEKNKFSKDLYKLLLFMSRNLKNINENNAVEYRNMLSPFLHIKKEGKLFEYYAVGHAHLDLAWLWPIRETKRKGARTFATQLHNIERYPNYVFGASQAQLYQWIKEGYPELYQQVKEKAKTKNWEVQGATWVEMDSNLIGGESLIRQFYYGKKFFKQEFGEDMKILWLPDSFGYSACLPQVMKLAGVDYFLTQKLSWNTVNKFPYHTFYWEGLDDSKVFAHMMPDNTYNSPVSGERMKFGIENYQEKEISNKAMMLFGIGNGGAGAGYEHLERLNRYKESNTIAKVIPKRAIDSFKILDDKVTDYPTYKGELYLEKHQGTLTTQSQNKFYNRKCEILLRNYEILALKAIENNIEIPISFNELEMLWKEILLYQFHDILPGSSIDRVYEESVVRYIEIFSKLTEAVKLLSENKYGSGILNLNSYRYKKVVEFRKQWYSIDIPPLSFITIENMQKISEFVTRADNKSIENEILKITFDKGCIVSIFDKINKKEFIAKGEKAGVFCQYSDIGDCWDIRPKNYVASKKRAKFVGFKSYLYGAIATAEIEFAMGESKIFVDYSISQGDELLTMDIKIDCKQKNKMLRLEFPFNIYTENCSFNVQFGHVNRKTTNNNSIEKAQYEVSAQKFVDISDKEFGISLLNDCKYGYKVKGNIIDINLIRSPLGGPGTRVDQGENIIKLALFPHKGEISSDTYKYAYLLNNPLLYVNEKSNSSLHKRQNSNIFYSNNENIVLESLKISEDKKSIVIALYNSTNTNQDYIFGYDKYKILGETDILEEKVEPIDGEIKFKPFELKIIKAQI